MQSASVLDPVRVWLLNIESPHTRATYKQAMKRLSGVTGLTPAQMLLEAKADMKTFWIRGCVPPHDVT